MIRFLTLMFFYLWRIIKPNTFCNIPFCMTAYLSEEAVKDRKTSKINDRMFLTRLAHSYGLMERGAWNFMTLVQTLPFSIMLYRRARIIEDFGNRTYAIPHDDVVVGPEEPGRWVRRHERGSQEEPPVIPVDEDVQWIGKI